MKPVRGKQLPPALGTAVRNPPILDTARWRCCNLNCRAWDCASSQQELPYSEVLITPWTSHSWALVATNPRATTDLPPPFLFISSSQPGFSICRTCCKVFPFSNRDWQESVWDLTLAALFSPNTEI